ncbi:MAG TPA: carboxypeptidase regulatory-like domain-containing protein [Terracidiphilus sp.]|nr:carboxypeptidase regulatory-like domain-containing protein [Terracidiphilus sp.]
MASAAPVCAQQPPPGTAIFSGRVVLPVAARKSHPPSIVVWLEPLDHSPSVQPPAPGHFTLVQKNRTFTPHLLVVPVGSMVSFPNEDPFFHNVFSLFNGKRFDLGLYEAGSSREVRFSREGVSYIFCNIHPEMSAVVIALSTPLYDVAGAAGSFSIHPVPPGVYELHVWIEGTPQPDLDRLSRRITLAAGQASSVTVDASSAYHPDHNHLNMFGKPYPSDNRSPY